MLQSDVLSKFIIDLSVRSLSLREPSAKEYHAIFRSSLVSLQFIIGYVAVLQDKRYAILIQVLTPYGNTLSSEKEWILKLTAPPRRRKLAGLIAYSGRDGFYARPESARVGCCRDCS